MFIDSYITETVSQYLQKIKTNYTTEQYAALMAALTELYYIPSRTLQLAEWHIYGSSRVGIYKANKPLAVIEDETITAVEYQTRIKYRYNGKKQYELSNHLGNVLVTISDRRTAICNEVDSTLSYEAVVVTATDYYSFGSPMIGRTYEGDTSLKYRYGFNGKENDTQIKGNGNSIAYEARIYDSRLGRMFSTDPREHEYAWQSTYAYYNNSPISSLDYFGAGGPYQETEPSTESTSSSTPKTINVFISPANPNKSLKMSLKQAEKAAAKSGGSLVVIKNVTSLKDLHSKLNEVTNNGEIKVQNLIFDSHGDYYDDQFAIGDKKKEGLVVHDGTGKSLEAMRKFLTDNSNVVLLACHAGGNGVNDQSGSLVENLSKTFNCTVYGCKSWTGAIGLFGGKMNVSQANPERFEDEQGKYDFAWNYLGQWKLASCGVVITLVNGISLSPNGEVIHKQTPSKFNNSTVRFKNLYTNHTTVSQRKFVTKVGNKIGGLIERF